MVVGELAGGRDVGRDHELLDQHVAGLALAGLDVHRLAGLVEDDAALGQLELDRAAAVAGLQEALVGRIEGLDDGLEERTGLGVGVAVTGRLHGLVGEAGA